MAKSRSAARNSTHYSVELLDAYRRLCTSTIANALDDLGVGGILVSPKPVVPRFRFVGPAHTVRETTGDYGSFPPTDFRVGAIVDSARPSDVVVVDLGGARISTWGGLASLAAKKKGIAGLVVHGGCRDVHEIDACDFPVCATHVVPTSGRRRLRVEAIGEPITIDGVTINPDDLIVADRTGIVCIPRAEADEVLALAQRFEADDRRAEERIRQGMTFTEAMNEFDRI